MARKAGKALKLYHYAVTALDSVEPCHFGANDWTRRDARYSVPRSFWYVKPSDREAVIWGDTLHTARVAGVYDLRSDKAGLVERFKGDIQGLLEYGQKHFVGYRYNVGFDIVCLFNSQKVEVLK